MYRTDDTVDVYGSRLTNRETQDLATIIQKDVNEFGLSLSDPDHVWLADFAHMDDLELSNPKSLRDLPNGRDITNEMFARLKEAKLIDIDEYTNVRQDLRHISEKTREYASRLADAGLCVIVPDIDTVAVLMDTPVNHNYGEAGTYLIDAKEHGSFLMALESGNGDLDYIENQAAITPLSNEAATEIRSFVAKNASQLAATWKTPDWQTSQSTPHEAASRLCEIVNELTSPQPNIMIAASTLNYQAWPEITKELEAIDADGAIRMSRKAPDLSAAMSELHVPNHKSAKQKENTLDF
jgi:hypothetical protein